MKRLLFSLSLSLCCLLGLLLSSTGASAQTTALIAPQRSFLDCHKYAYEVRYANGALVEKTVQVYQGPFLIGTITVQLWYCTNYQSNFARARWNPTSSASFSQNTTVQVRLFKGAHAEAVKTLVPGTPPNDGTQDSPVLFAPVITAAACLPDFNACTGFR